MLFRSVDFRIQRNSTFFAFTASSAGFVVNTFRDIPLKPRRVFTVFEKNVYQGKHCDVLSSVSKTKTDNTELQLEKKKETRAVWFLKNLPAEATHAKNRVLDKYLPVGPRNNVDEFLGPDFYLPDQISKLFLPINDPIWPTEPGYREISEITMNRFRARAKEVFDRHAQYDFVWDSSMMGNRGSYRLPTLWEKAMRKFRSYGWKGKLAVSAGAISIISTVLWCLRTM